MKRISGVIAAAALAAILGVTMGAAASAKAGGIMAEHAWARATMAAVKNGAAYVTLRNHGEETDHVVAAETPVAKHAGLHGHSMKDGVMQMHPVEQVEVAPGGTVVFEPGGLHIMLMQLDHPLKEGESFPLTLKLASGDSLDVTVKVKAMGAMSGGHGDHGEHEHGHGDHDHED